MRRLHVSAHHFLHLRPFTSEDSIQKIGRYLSLRHGCSRCVLQCVFSAPPGASQSSTVASKDDHATDNSDNCSQHGNLLFDLIRIPLKWHRSSPCGTWPFFHPPNHCQSHLIRPSVAAALMILSDQRDAQTEDGHEMVKFVSFPFVPELEPRSAWM